MSLILIIVSMQTLSIICVVVDLCMCTFEICHFVHMLQREFIDKFDATDLLNLILS